MFLLLLVSSLAAAWELDANVMLPVPARAVELNSTEGFAILVRSQYRSYRAVASHFTTQDTQSLCGIASAVAVLNGMNVPPPVDPVYEPYAYWTQSDLASNECLAAIHDPAHGSTRAQLAAMLSCLVRVQDVPAPASVGELRQIVAGALADSAKEHLIVNFDRADLDAEAGGGHFSPVVAYDAQEDLALLMDVARYKYPPMWFPLQDLWRSTLRVDSSSNQSRGFLVLSPPGDARWAAPRRGAVVGGAQ